LPWFLVALRGGNGYYARHKKEISGMNGKTRAPRNRTLAVTPEEESRLDARLVAVSSPMQLDAVLDRTICQDMESAVAYLPGSSVDLLFLDPPYNLTRTFGSENFRAMDPEMYEGWMEGWFRALPRLLKPAATVYICGDWRSSSSIHAIASRHLKVRNRITWEREKGRGAKSNWKNASEDIWFCTVSDRYTFNGGAVKLKRRVVAPYTDSRGFPKDWEKTEGGGFRLTHPSNLWTDITVPFWSMPENTDHPTQKPEKLLAKLILASTNPGDMVLDPFLGSGTSSVVAKKLGRRFIGIEKDRQYCLIAEKRLELAEKDGSIQGYRDGVFWERNALSGRK
jgi:site-specific DNA-methyltransferase (adenine-specific)